VAIPGLLVYGGIVNMGPNGEDQVSWPAFPNGVLAVSLSMGTSGASSAPYWTGLNKGGMNIFNPEGSSALVSWMVLGY
jgi:hypothetical protein